MTLTRRHFVGITVTGAAALAIAPAGMVHASAADDAIAAFTGGATPASSGITLIVPEIAENGNNVPVEVDAPGAEAIKILASGNPNPEVATFEFGPLSGSSMASTRVRLAGEQDVIAVARMADGSFVQASANVRVTIGGCGG